MQFCPQSNVGGDLQSPTYCFRGFVIPIPLNRSLALEGKQLVSVVLVLLAACRDFGRETRLEGSGQGLEAVEDICYSLLLLDRWYRYFYASKCFLRYIRNRTNTSKFSYF